MFKHELGAEVKDKITGFKGLVVGRTEYLTGCRRYTLQSRSLGKDGKPQDWLTFDEDQLELSRKAAPKKIRTPGGPQQIEAGGRRS